MPNPNVVRRSILVGAADTTAPVITVDTLTTSDTTPTVTGTVDDPDATIEITVNSNTYSGTNAGDGTWSADVTDALTAGQTYDVAATATDAAGNVGTDATTDELTILTDAVAAVLVDSTPTAAGNKSHTTATFGGGTPTLALTATSAVVPPATTQSDSVWVGLGATDGTNEGVASSYSQNGVGFTNNRNTANSAVTVSTTAPPAYVDTSGAFSAFAADGVTLTYADVGATNSGIARNVLFGFLSGPSVYIETVTIPSAGGTYTISCGFPAELVMMFYPTSPGSAEDNHSIGIGAAANGTSIKQYSIQQFEQDGVDNGAPELTTNDSNIYTDPSGAKGAITAFGATTVTLTKTDWVAANDAVIVAIGGNQADIVEIEVPNQTAPYEETYPVKDDLNPVLLVGVGSSAVAWDTTYTNDNAQSMSIGFAGRNGSGTISQGYHSWQIEDAAATTNANHAMDKDAFIYVYDESGTVLAEGVISEINASNFKINWTTISAGGVGKIGFVAVVGRAPA